VQLQFSLRSTDNGCDIYHKSNENTDKIKTSRAAAIVHNSIVLFYDHTPAVS